MLPTDTQPIVINASGELDIAAAPELARRVRAALEQCRGSVLVVDLHDCTFMDSTALGALADLRATARKDGIELRLERVPPRVERMLALLGLSAAFGVSREQRAEQRAELRARAGRARAEQRERKAELAARTSSTADTVARLAQELAEARVKIENLQVALQTNRRIGQALGIIMERLKVTETDAFEVLRVASQHQHCKLRDLAEQVVQTGQIPTAA
jgi:anti-anti-sigma factor